jgi:hypothetical protein
MGSQRSTVGWSRPVRSFRARSLTVTVAATAAALIVFLGPVVRRVSGQTKSSRLSTVLADLAGAPIARTLSFPAAPAAAQQQTFNSLPGSVQEAMRSRRLRIDNAGGVQVTLLMTEVTDDTLRQVSAQGAVVEIADARNRRVQARVPAGLLTTIAALPSVNFVRPPSYARRQVGAVTTEGDSILNADIARQQFAIDGTGVRVGVISDGLKGVFATGCTACGGATNGPIASGDLPNSTGTRTTVLTTSTGGITGQSFQANHDLEGLPPSTPPCGFAGAGAEGTALLEVVHDVAPGAQLAFANADTDLAFNQAVNFLASTNDVVVDDLGFYGFPYDGTSTVSANTASALNNNSNRIRAYVTAGGNGADGHYIGSYVDSGVDVSNIPGVVDTGHAHRFQGTSNTTDVLGLGAQPHDVLTLPTNGEVVIFLTWDDPFGGSRNDYDLYLVRQSTNQVVARSIDPQVGTQDPIEAVDFTNTGALDTFQIIVQNVENAAAPRTLNLFLFAPECAFDGPRLLAPGQHGRHNYNTVTQSVSAQSDAGGSPVSVITVGAICSATPAAAAAFAGSIAPSESCNDRTHQTVEFFSSQGPTIDGRMKPDIAAIDGVSVTGAGSFENPFFGTSAAAPHVAGETALLLQAAPCLLTGATGAVDVVSARASLRNLILSGATTIGGSPNNMFGLGLANAFASAQKTLPIAGGPPSLVVSGNAPGGANVNAATLGFSDPNHCPVSRLNWTGGCGSGPGAALACPFGTSSVSVSASNNGLSFSQSSPFQITVTNFGLSASPSSATVNAGQSAAYRVTLAAQGGAFSNSVNLACGNLPTGATCVFGPSSLAPGAGSADTTLTIVTTARTTQGRTASMVPGVFGITLVAALAPLVVLARRPRSRRRALIALAAVQIACGSSGSPLPIPTPTSSPTPTPTPGSPAAGVAPVSLTFGNQLVQTPSAQQTITLSNTGGAALTVSSIAASGDFSQANNCGGSVAAGASCAISVTFTPTTTGVRAGAITITDNASTSPQTVSLTGTGVVAQGGTPAGTYQIAVTGTSGSLVQSQSVTLIVQ